MSRLLLRRTLNNYAAHCRHNASVNSGGGREIDGPYRKYLTYKVNISLLSHCLQESYVALDYDAGTHEFMASCSNYSLWKDTAASLLRYFVSRTDANGFLGRGQMFVLSTEHTATLLKRTIAQFGSLLDIGAGDGNVTLQMGKLFQHVAATEVSKPMVNQLSQKGFEVIKTADISSKTFEPERRFDVISVMNVLDRCDKPLDLLRECSKLLVAETGKILLAVVLPFDPFVEDGSYKRAPSQSVGLKRPSQYPTFEAAANDFAEKVLVAQGFKVHAFSRVPYLCQGDSYEPFYQLDDAIFVISPEMPLHCKPE